LMEAVLVRSAAANHQHHHASGSPVGKLGTDSAHSVDATLPIRLRGTVAAGGLHAARLTMRIEIRPRGVLGTLAPIVAMLMRRTALEKPVRITEAVERRYVG
jgi:hypothetical protein